MGRLFPSPLVAASANQPLYLLHDNRVTVAVRADGEVAVREIDADAHEPAIFQRLRARAVTAARSRERWGRRRVASVTPSKRVGVATTHGFSCRTYRHGGGGDWVQRNHYGAPTPICNLAVRTGQTKKELAESKGVGVDSRL